MNIFFDLKSILCSVVGSIILGAIVKAFKWINCKLDKNRIKHLEKFCHILEDRHNNSEKLLAYLGFHVFVSLIVMFFALLTNIRFSGHEFREQMVILNFGYVLIFSYFAAYPAIVCYRLVNFEESVSNYEKEIAKLRKNLERKR